MIRPLNVKEVKYVAFWIAKKLMDFDEPIPDFSTRIPGTLESCLKTPFQDFNQKPLYPTLVKKAAILFYLMVKNHPFENGNKRIAITTLLNFLFKNKKWLRVDPAGLYDFAVWVAKSPAKEKKRVVRKTEKFIEEHLIKVSDLPTGRPSSKPKKRRVR
jgi:death on curing protein